MRPAHWSSQLVFAVLAAALAERRTGRREGRTCVAAMKGLLAARKCVRAVVRGTLTRKSRRGMDHVAFSGRIGSTALKPGSYQATLTATDSQDNTSTATTTFKIAGG